MQERAQAAIVNFKAKKAAEDKQIDEERDEEGMERVSIPKGLGRGRDMMGEDNQIQFSEDEEGDDASGGGDAGPKKKLSKQEMEERAKNATYNKSKAEPKATKPAAEKVKVKAKAKVAKAAPAEQPVQMRSAQPAERTLSAAEEKKASERQTLMAVTKLIQENNVSAQDAMAHAKLLKDVKVRKKGDAQRILLMNMVKVSRIAVHAFHSSKQDTHPACLAMLA